MSNVFVVPATHCALPLCRQKNIFRWLMDKVDVDDFLLLYIAQRNNEDFVFRFKEEPLCCVFRHVGWVSDLTDVLNATSCESVWVLIGCQCPFRSSNRSSSDPNDIIHYCHCYNCGVVSTVHFGWITYLNYIFTAIYGVIGLGVDGSLVHISQRISFFKL